MRFSPFIVIVEALGKVANEPLYEDSSFERSIEELGRGDMTTDQLKQF